MKKKFVLLVLSIAVLLVVSTTLLIVYEDYPKIPMVEAKDTAVIRAKSTADCTDWLLIHLQLKRVKSVETKTWDKYWRNSIFRSTAWHSFCNIQTGLLTCAKCV